MLILLWFLCKEFAHLSLGSGKLTEERRSLIKGGLILEGIFNFKEVNEISVAYFYASLLQ